jgi:glyoxylase-like metal-dependent hydrolase (beta-lactamase superfamily II)
MINALIGKFIKSHPFRGGVEVRKFLRIIEGPGSGRYPYSNSLLVGRSCLIDAGAGEALRDVRVDWVLNSHWHEDHIALNKVGRRVAVHYLDAEAVQDYEEFKRRYALGDLVRLFVNFEFRRVDRTFEDGDVFEFDGVHVEVLHVPGHSAGHSCFIIDDVMFLADVDLTLFGPWYGCLDCDVKDFVLSIERLKKEVRERGISLAIPSHGKPVSGTEEILKRLDDYLAKIFERDRRIRELVRSGEDPVGKGIIYKKVPEPKEIFLHFERIMIEKHLAASLNELYPSSRTGRSEAIP